MQPTLKTPGVAIYLVVGEGLFLWVLMEEEVFLNRERTGSSPGCQPLLPDTFQPCDYFLRSLVKCTPPILLSKCLCLLALTRVSKLPGPPTPSRCVPTHRMEESAA